MKTKSTFLTLPIDPTRKKSYVNDGPEHHESDPCETDVSVTPLKNIDRAKFQAMIATITFWEEPIDPTRKRIYLNDVAWYYEDDLHGKEMMEAAVAILEKIDFSKLEGNNKKGS